MKYGQEGSFKYFLDRDIPNIDKWTLLRKRGKDTLSERAQLKLEWIIFYHTIGKNNAMHTATHFGINPKTLHKWKKRFHEKDIATLEEGSRAPLHVRKRQITPLQRVRMGRYPINWTHILTNQ